MTEPENTDAHGKDSFFNVAREWISKSANVRAPQKFLRFAAQKINNSALDYYTRGLFSKDWKRNEGPVMGKYSGKILAFTCGFYLSFVIPKGVAAENPFPATPAATIAAQR